jgi:hypothetical protein
MWALEEWRAVIRAANASNAFFYPGLYTPPNALREVKVFHKEPLQTNQTKAIHRNLNMNTV